jgi:hypothetical protein
LAAAARSCFSGEVSAVVAAAEEEEWEEVEQEEEFSSFCGAPAEMLEMGIIYKVIRIFY